MFFVLLLGVLISLLTLWKYKFFDSHCQIIKVFQSVNFQMCLLLWPKRFVIKQCFYCWKIIGRCFDGIVLTGRISNVWFRRFKCTDTDVMFSITFSTDVMQFTRTDQMFFTKIYKTQTLLSQNFLSWRWLCYFRHLEDRWLFKLQNSYFLLKLLWTLNAAAV